MSFVNEKGEPTTPIRKLEFTDEEIERVRDMIIVKFKALHVNERTIAKILRMTQPAINKRYRAILPEAREHYARQTLGQLASSHSQG